MKVLKPNKNKLTQGYSESHKGYDHSGRGDQNYYSSFHGVVTLAKNSETKNWINKGKLTTADYGNYIKIKANVNGKTVYQFGAHFKPGTVLPKGTEVKAGQVVAQIGNTGNSTAAHSHTEYRDSSDQKFKVEFIDKVEEPKKDEQTKEQIILDVYKALTGEYANDDVKQWRLQQNKNTVELIDDILKGDSSAKQYILDLWDIDASKNDWRAVAEQYERSFQDVKDLLDLSHSADTEKVHGAIKGLIEENTRLRKENAPKVVYKSEGKDFEVWFKFINFKVIGEVGKNE